MILTMTYRIDCTVKYGILLWVEAPCGIKQPLMRWADIKEVRKFGEDILDFCNYKEKTSQETGEQKQEEPDLIVEELLRQALGDEGEYA
jgi:hypothetical protein